MIIKNCRLRGVTEVFNPNSVYLRALLGFENAEGPKDTVELNVERSK